MILVQFTEVNVNTRRSSVHQNGGYLSSCLTMCHIIDYSFLRCPINPRSCLVTHKTTCFTRSNNNPLSSFLVAFSAPVIYRKIRDMCNTDFQETFLKVTKMAAARMNVDSCWRTMTCRHQNRKKVKRFTSKWSDKWDAGCFKVQNGAHGTGRCNAQQQ